MLQILNYLNNLDIDSVTNHPVHIITKDNKISTSAFIPFCEFGGNMSSMGVKINQFQIPVCNSFKPKILNSQNCYDVDLAAGPAVHALIF